MPAQWGRSRKYHPRFKIAPAEGLLVCRHLTLQASGLLVVQPLVEAQALLGRAAALINILRLCAVGGGGQRRQQRAQREDGGGGVVHVGLSPRLLLRARTLKVLYRSP